MLRSFLIGVVAGQRGIAPLASLATAARRGTLDTTMPLAPLFQHPLISSGAIAFAAAEMAGDKMKTAPDRIVATGLIVRSITSAYAGAAYAPRDRRVAGAAIAVTAALASSYIGWRMRCAAMRRYGQTPTGFVEDAMVMGAGVTIADPSIITRN